MVDKTRCVRGDKCRRASDIVWVKHQIKHKSAIKHSKHLPKNMSGESSPWSRWLHKLASMQCATRSSVAQNKKYKCNTEILTSIRAFQHTLCLSLLLSTPSASVRKQERPKTYQNKMFQLEPLSAMLEPIHNFRHLPANLRNIRA